MTQHFFTKINNYWQVVLIVTAIITFVASVAVAGTSLKARVDSHEELLKEHTVQIKELDTKIIDHSLDEATFLTSIKKDLDYLKENSKEMKQDIKELKNK